MSDVYLIFGYGIPRDIVRDVAYRRYLRGVLTAIRRDVRARHVQQPLIITSGGRTDVFAPYHRLEGSELRRGFRAAIRARGWGEVTRDWQLRVEPTALSTLENITGSHALLRRYQIRPRCVTIFCAPTRAMRVRRIAPLVFARTPVRVVSIAFSRDTDPAANAATLRRKERRAIACDLWALGSSKRFRRYHRVFVRKTRFLRSLGARGGHPQLAGVALHDWWQRQIRRLPKTP